jgi:transposase
LKRQKKEEGMNSKNRNGFEDGSNTLKNTIKKSSKKFSEIKIAMKIGILKKTYHVSVHYTISIISSIIGRSLKVTGLTSKFHPRNNTKMTHPGVYSIRTNIFNLSGQEIWDTYTKQTIVEGVFRSLKSELGLRPIYHRKDERIDGHFFISILAYQCVNWIRKSLKLYSINCSWDNIALKIAKIGIARRIRRTAKGCFVKPYVSVANHTQRQIYNAVGFTC